MPARTHRALSYSGGGWPGRCKAASATVSSRWNLWTPGISAIAPATAPTSPQLRSQVSALRQGREEPDPRRRRSPSRETKLVKEGRPATPTAEDNPHDDGETACPENTAKVIARRTLPSRSPSRLTARSEVSGHT